MGYVDRYRGGDHRAVVGQADRQASIDALRLVLVVAVNEHFISIEFEAAATNQQLAGLSKLANMSLSVQLIKGQSI